MIVVENVLKRYGETAVVDGVDLSIAKGGLTAVIGPNGAGKSTLLSLISRLLPMDGGRVMVDTLDVQMAGGDLLAQRLAILRQENSVMSRLTIRDLVAFGRYPHSKGRPTAEDLAHVDRALDHMNLTGLADRFLDELSGGQRQRAFVAMVLCQDTDYVLLDEPLNNLDLPHAVVMMKRLRAAVDELGKTVVVVLHDINFAAAYADRILAMRDGRVVLDGPPEEIVTPSALKTIYDLDVTVLPVNGRPVAIYYR